jgi:NADPH2:quinone reductase
MKAIGVQESLPITNPDSLVSFETAIKKPAEDDILVKVKAFSVNPIDTKIRMSLRQRITRPRILGFDGVGEVVAVGENVQDYQIGETIFYLNSKIKPGSNAEYQLVNPTMAAKVPQSCSLAGAATLPLVSLTAYEALFERLAIPFESKTQQSILILNGAGGVGSMAIQLAKLAGLNVVASASREETRQWVESMGADAVINHHHNLVDECELLGPAAYEFDYVLDLHGLDTHFDEIVELLAPNGRLCTVGDGQLTLDSEDFKSKSLSLSFESVFTKSFYKTQNLNSQHTALTQIAEWIDNNQLKAPLTETFKGLTVENLQKAHAVLETKQMIGKLVIEL